MDRGGSMSSARLTGDITFHLTPPSADYWSRWLDGLGALVCGRILFDFTGGWDGTHTVDVPVVVVTHQVPTDWVEAHPDAPFHFVTDGVQAAVAMAREIAGERTVGGDGRHHCPTVPRARPARRCGHRPGARGHGRGPPVLRRAVGGGCPTGRSDPLHPGGPRHPPHVPRNRTVERELTMRTLHAGLRVQDLDRSRQRVSSVAPTYARLGCATSRTRVASSLRVGPCPTGGRHPVRSSWRTCCS